MSVFVVGLSVVHRYEIRKKLKEQRKKERKKQSKKSDMSGSKSPASSGSRSVDRRKAMDDKRTGSKKMNLLEELKAKREEKKRIGKICTEVNR